MHQMISRGHGGIANGLCRARQGNERMHDGWEYRGRAAFRFPFWFSGRGTNPKEGPGRIVGLDSRLARTHLVLQHVVN